VREAPAGGFGGRRVGRIVELEAYVGEDDRASHARFGRTSRNAVMYGPPGVAYVYLVYGMYDCLNITTEPEGRPAALLVRAVEPVEGVEAMRAARLGWSAARRRDRTGSLQAVEAARLAAVPDVRLASGPGLVTAAFDIDRTATGLDLLDPRSPLRLEGRPPSEAAPEILTTTRVGIDYAGSPWLEKPWRFTVVGSGALSGPANNAGRSRPTPG
jgi:DNA-3-methyladenine glycosylase